MVIPPLYCACQEGHKDLVTYLVKHGGSIDQENNDGF